MVPVLELKWAQVKEAIEAFIGDTTGARCTVRQIAPLMMFIFSKIYFVSCCKASTHYVQG